MGGIGAFTRFIDAPGDFVSFWRNFAGLIALSLIFCFVGGSWKKIKETRFSGTMPVSYTHLDVYKRQPLDRIARVGSQDPAVPKRELLNLAAMGGQALWIELAEPLEVRGLTGKPRLVRAIKTTPDDAAAFKDALRPRS